MTWEQPKSAEVLEIEERIRLNDRALRVLTTPRYEVLEQKLNQHPAESLRRRFDHLMRATNPATTVLFEYTRSGEHTAIVGVPYAVTEKEVVLSPYWKEDDTLGPEFRIPISEIQWYKELSVDRPVRRAIQPNVNVYNANPEPETASSTVRVA
ncbi:hypothetical protein HY489_01765 [Candidatus Woesearchaeota archaeon]|nr:hypothetical protein [Candidatus Woesearchaeota archaeon]